MNLVASATLFPSTHREVGVVLKTFPISPSSELKHFIAETAPDEEQLFIELFFAIHFAIRQLSNLGNGPDANSLADRLQRLRYQEDGQSTTLSDSQGILVNIENPQQRDGKQICVELLIAGQKSQMTINSSGFGFLNRKVWSAVPNSVVALFLALAARNPEDRIFIRRVLLACGEVARQWRNGQVSLTNHTQAALFSTIGVWSVSIEGEYTEDRAGM